MSWYSNVLSATSKSISSLKSTLLASEADGDTDDDTHVCRVLRAYYNEKGRPLPSWLPPDPKAPPPPPVQQSPNYAASRYGGLNNSQPPSSGNGSGFSSLWASDPAPQQQVPSSLRAGRGAGRTGSAPSPFGTSEGGRPGLPSQRSYQTGGVTTPPPGTGGTTSAGDRLRQRLYGGGGARTASPAGNSAFQPPSNTPSSANAPWISGENEFMGGGAPGQKGGGLPSGPRRQGLPKGPRMR